MKELNIKSRLHNEADVLEVDDKSLSEAVIPFIEADKDIISKIRIEYLEEDNETGIYFPDGVMPISWYDKELGVILYLDYTSQRLVNYNGDEVGSISTGETGNIEVYISSEDRYTPDRIASLQYIFFNNTDDVTDYTNWYEVLRPKPGTKLYRHNLVLSGFDDTHEPTTCEMTLYTTKNASIAGSYTSANDVAGKLYGISLYCFDGESSYELTSAIAISQSNEVQLVNVNGSAPSFMLSSSYPLTITDTVTPL